MLLSILGAPFSSGSQNNIRYAVFPHRLAGVLNDNEFNSKKAELLSRL
jgi:hypothetical protein